MSIYNHQVVSSTTGSSAFIKVDMLTVRIEAVFEDVNHFLGRNPRLQHVAGHVEDLAIVALLLQLVGHVGVENAGRIAQAIHIGMLERDRSEERVSGCFYFGRGEMEKREKGEEREMGRGRKRKKEKGEEKKEERIN